MTSGSSPDSRVVRVGSGDLACGQARDRRGDRRDVGRGGAAAAAGHVEQPVPGPLAERLGHLLGGFVVTTEVVRQPGIRVRRDGAVGDPRQDVEVLAQAVSGRGRS